jgi:hypothetical protein
MRDVVLLTLLSACAEDAPEAPPPEVPTLDGVWAAEEDCGEAASGEPLRVMWTLRVGGASARIEGIGARTDVRMDARVVEQDGRVGLVLEAADTGSGWSDQLGPGAVLMTALPSESGPLVTMQELPGLCRRQLMFRREVEAG